MFWIPESLERGGDLKISTVRRGVIVFFVLFVMAVVWPGMLPFNRIQPLVLGLPFSMAWIGGWVILSFLVLSLLDRIESRARREREEDG
jgi:hypothetical protein